MPQVRSVSTAVWLLQTAITEASQTTEIQIDNTPVVNKAAVLPLAHELAWNSKAAGDSSNLYIQFFHHPLNLRGKMTQLDKLKGVHLERLCVRYYQEVWKCCLQWLFVHTGKGDVFPALLSCVYWSIKSCVWDLKVLWLIAEPEYIDPVTLKWCLVLPWAPERFIQRC